MSRHIEIRDSFVWILTDSHRLLRTIIFNVVIVGLLWDITIIRDNDGSLKCGASSRGRAPKRTLIGGFPELMTRAAYSRRPVKLTRSSSWRAKSNGRGVNRCIGFIPTEEEILRFTIKSVNFHFPHPINFFVYNQNHSKKYRVRIDSCNL